MPCVWQKKIGKCIDMVYIRTALAAHAGHAAGIWLLHLHRGFENQQPGERNGGARVVFHQQASYRPSIFYLVEKTSKNPKKQKTNKPKRKVLSY